MKLIPLSATSKTIGGKYFAKVDDEWYDYLMQWKWHVRTKHGIYAQRVENRNITISMHRVIMGVTDPKLHVDHIDHDSLNNQKSNLRICTPSQNQMNRKKNKNGSSPYRGVSIHIRKTYDKPKWIAIITSHKKRHYLGIFDTAEEAAREYDKYSKILNGEFANFNFPNEVI